jgi:hypothetical protein
MEITCTRCHRTVEDENCYCPACGLPRLTYSTDEPNGQIQPEQWNEAVRDASAVDWKVAQRTAIVVAVPAGMLCSMVSPVGIMGLLWMAIAALWTVILYVRRKQSAWITTGAGARIGLVTGLLGTWTAAATSGIALFVMRFLQHQGNAFDELWQSIVNENVVPQWTASGMDAHMVDIWKSNLLSPEGRAGAVLAGISLLSCGLLLFAVGGGALGARMVARRGTPQS